MMQTRSLMLAAMLSISATSNGVLASGTHAGGHDDEAIGVPGDPAKVTRTIAVDMSDNMRFTPDRIKVSRGETIRFRISNSGKLKHELVLGTKKELEEHYKAMLKFPEMEHEEENMVTLAPAKTGEIVWKFTKSGKVDFACLKAGHYDAGMKGQVIVTAKKKQGYK
ncbi:MAG: cupredoxin family protein [Burkholderiales bacterium]|nr:cupredoxin family protein [Burkholderiales bacterium]